MFPTIHSLPLAQPRSAHVSLNESAPPPPMARGSPERATTFLLASRTSKDHASPSTVYPFGHTRVTWSPAVLAWTQPSSSTANVPRRSASMPLRSGLSDVTMRSGEDKHPLAVVTIAKVKANPITSSRGRRILIRRTIRAPPGEREVPGRCAPATPSQPTTLTFPGTAKPRQSG
jgi:hypothetical protein